MIQQLEFLLNLQTEKALELLLTFVLINYSPLLKNKKKRYKSCLLCLLCKFSYNDQGGNWKDKVSFFKNVSGNSNV